MADRGEQIRRMKDPNAWPLWPVLPLKHSTEKEGPMPRLAAMLENFEVWSTSEEDFPPRPKRLLEKYYTAEAVYAAGWRVD